MISQLEIVNARYSGLEQRFPQSLRLDLNPEINLLVGPNYSGKTALLRMLATSIGFEQYYLKNGISRYHNYFAVNDLEDTSKIHEDLTKAREGNSYMKDWFVAPYGIRGSRFQFLCKLYGIDINQEEDFRKYNPDPSRIDLYISREARDKLLTLDTKLREPTDLNIWGFVKAHVAGDGDIFFQHFDLPYDEYIEGEGLIYGERNHMRYVDFRFNTRYNSLPGETIDIPSPGAGLFKKLSGFFETNITKFFEDQVNLVWGRQRIVYDRLLAPVTGHTTEYAGFKLQERVSKNGRLCVIMDEPTIFLDARNKFRFQELIGNYLEKYPDRLQFFIATNDYALIKGLEGRCRFLNLYEIPAVSSMEFDVHK